MDFKEGLIPQGNGSCRAEFTDQIVAMVTSKTIKAFLVNVIFPFYIHRILLLQFSVNAFYYII